MADLDNYKALITDTLHLKSTITRSRWKDEAELLLECSKITLNDDSNVKQELKTSDFHKITYGVLSELFREREHKDLDVKPGVSNELSQSFLMERLEKLDNLLELENVTSLQIDIPEHLRDDEDITPACLQEYQEKVLQVKNVSKLFSFH